MMQKVSDYIADFFADHGIRTVYTVVGGGAMHMNDSFGHHPRLTCVYNHHEQASAMAAEAHFRVNGEMAGLCVTSGPGALNALNGVAGAYQDSIPLLVVSGQVKTTLLASRSGLRLRTMGGQEFDICSALENIAKYSVTVMDPADIRFVLEKALHAARSGRPGPAWLDVPVDIQGARVETADLRGYDPLTDPDWIREEETRETPDSLREKISRILAMLREAERPVFYAGNGIRISGSRPEMLEVIRRLKLPTVTCWDSIDLLETEHPLYVGRPGTMGDRPGNFAVQNSDLVLSVGARLSIYQVGYNRDTWARAARIIDVDIDDQELRKPIIRVDLPVCCDAKLFLQTMLDCLRPGDEAKDRESWLERCRAWKKRYPVVSEKHFRDQRPMNVYALVDSLSRSLPAGTVTVAANGSASVVGSAAYYIGKGSRFLMNCAISSMGYELPAAVGACVAGGKRPVICLAGDGSIMMNLQELQTIVTNRLPVKIVLIANQGYHQIRLTQTNLFEKHFVGIGPESGDLGFPDFGKVAGAFGIPYLRCGELAALPDALRWLNDQPGFCMLEAEVTTTQVFEPKSATRRLEDGSLYSPPLEDLAPFLSREELADNMLI